MPLSRKGWEFAEKLFAQKVTRLHESRSNREADARRKTPGSSVAWIPEVYRESTHETAHAWVESFIEAVETESSSPSQEDLDEARKRIAGAVKAGLEAAAYEARRIAQATGSAPLGAIQSQLALKMAGVTSDLHRELAIWVARRELQGSGAPPRWWLDDPEEGHDGLLPLPTRKAYDQDVIQGVADASPDHPLALLFIDIDHFKKVNDEHGHGAGDAALLSVARQLRAAVASRGKAYRYGGEELILLLPNSHEAEAVATAERVRMAASAHVIPEIKRPVTLSIGVAIATSPQMPPEELCKRADTAMYEAKKTRDAVASWREDLPPKSPR